MVLLIVRDRCLMRFELTLVYLLDVDLLLSTPLLVVDLYHGLVLVVFYLFFYLLRYIVYVKMVPTSNTLLHSRYFTLFHFNMF